MCASSQDVIIFGNIIILVISMLIKVQTENSQIYMHGKKLGIVLRTKSFQKTVQPYRHNINLSGTGLLSV